MPMTAMRLLTLTVLLLSFATAMAGWPMAGARAASFLERAQEYLDAGDPNAAAIELKNALQRDPNDAEARFLLGKVHLELGDSQSAEKEFLRARELGYAGEELDLYLAYARLGQGQYDKITSELKEDLPIETDLQRDLHVARGEALLGLGRFDEAQAIFDRVLRDGPHLRAIVNKARIAIALGNSETARALLDQAAEIDANDPDLAAVDAGWYFHMRRFEEAKDRFDHAAELDPTSLENHIGRIQARIALRELDEAARLVDELDASSPGNPAIILQRAIVRLMQGQYAQASSAAERVLALTRNQPQALLVAGQAAYELGEYEKARVHLGAYVAQNPENEGARVALGATLMRLGYPKEAYGTLSEVGDEAILDNPAYLDVLTAAAFGAGDREAGMKYLEQLAVRQPDNPDVQERLGIARQSQGDAAGAAAALEQAIALQPDRLSAYSRLFAVHLNGKELDQAIATARRIQAQFSDKAIGDTLLGIAYLTKGDRVEARQAFEQALAREPDNAEAAGNLANLLVVDGKIGEARALLDTILEAQPGHLRTLMAAAQVASDAGDGAAAEKYWRQAIDTNPEARLPRVLLGIHYVETNRAAEALAVTEPALVANPRSLGLLETVGQARLRTGDATGALQAFETLAALAPTSAPAQEHLMRALEYNGRIPEALKAARRTLELDPDNLPARLGEVRYLAQTGKLEEARTKLEPLKAEFPGQVDLVMLEGRIALVEGRSGEAVSLYRSAFETAANSATLIELTRALYADGKGAEAMEMLRNWVAEYPQDVMVRTVLAEALIGSGQLAEADKEYEAILERTPNNVRALNNLAWLRMKLGKPDEAVALGRKAVMLAPKSPSVADTLAVILLETGEKKEAFDLLQLARQEAADNATIHFHFAQALAANGDVESAVAELRELLKDGRAFRERPEAEALLAQLTQ